MTKTGLAGRFRILNFGHWCLPFDSFDLEALDRFAQGGELVEPFDICALLFEICSSLLLHYSSLSSFRLV
jgi:hypothetical protein